MITINPLYPVIHIFFFGSRLYHYLPTLNISLKIYKPFKIYLQRYILYSIKFQLNLSNQSNLFYIPYSGGCWKHPPRPWLSMAIILWFRYTALPFKGFSPTWFLKPYTCWHLFIQTVLGLVVEANSIQVVPADWWFRYRTFRVSPWVIRIFISVFRPHSYRPFSFYIVVDTALHLPSIPQYFLTHTISDMGDIVTYRHLLLW